MMKYNRQQNTDAMPRRLTTDGAEAATTLPPCGSWKPGNISGT